MGSMQTLCLLAGGDLHGRSLVAGDTDIETGGGDIDVGKLMGTFVHVSTEDAEVHKDACGAVKCGAIYADSLHLITGQTAAHATMGVHQKPPDVFRMQARSSTFLKDPLCSALACKSF